MTPNKPVIAEEARKLLTDANSKLDNDMLDMVSRLADVITYNAEAMNKLVNRVDELEKLVTHESVSETPEEGEYLEVLLKRGANKVRCVKAESHAYIVNKVYVVERRAEDGTKFVRNEQGVQCGISSSLFVVWYTTIPVCSVVQQSVQTKDDAEHFLAVTRMFMGLPTVQLIHPRSL